MSTPTDPTPETPLTPEDVTTIIEHDLETGAAHDIVAHIAEEAMAPASTPVGEPSVVDEPPADDLAAVEPSTPVDETPATDEPAPVDLAASTGEQSNQPPADTTGTTVGSLAGPSDADRDAAWSSILGFVASALSIATSAGLALPNDFSLGPDWHAYLPEAVV